MIRPEIEHRFRGRFSNSLLIKSIEYSQTADVQGVKRTEVVS